MKRMILLLLKTIGILILILVLAFGGLLLYGTLTDYSPEEKISVETKGKAGFPVIQDSTLSLMIWNIGYCGLGNKADFFYDGGQSVISPAADVEEYRKGAVNYLSKHSDIDFLLLQEVDMNSKRSHFVDQSALIAGILPEHNEAIGVNYNVKFIAYPFFPPMGKVKSGLATYSKYQSQENTRYQFPGNFSWPKRIYMLDRCFLLQRFKVKNGKELIVINTHNSAYDDGSLKQQQNEYLKKVLMTEYEQGHYVIVGGDWNQTPPGFDNLSFAKPNGEAPYHQINIDRAYMPADWKWVYDPKVATNRKVRKPYDADSTFTTLIDFFLISPNLELIEVRGDDQQFEFSDHQPVFMKVGLMDP